jgi:WD40 repeat protein
MSGLASPDHVLETRGVHRALDAFVVSATFDRAGLHAAFALGDGSLHVIALPDRETWHSHAVHDGAVLALAAAPGAGFVTGGDDGRLRLTTPVGESRDMEQFGSRWVERVATHPTHIAAAVGKRVHVFDAGGEKLKTLEHPSSVTGLVFDAKGKCLAASHYGGVSLWLIASKSDNPRRLEWKGSHIGIVMSPDGDSVVTAMQENALHGWRLSDAQHMRMSGYPSKTQSMGFTWNGKFLATAGAEAVVLWPFTGGGPMGKSPTELAGGDNVLCSMVACHPQNDVCAAGFSDGLVIIADIASARILPICAPGRGPVSALAWSPDGSTLAFGTETGFAALVDLSQR